MKTVVVSAVNIRKGGTLTILRQCLGYLSTRDDLRVIAVVHSRSLCDYSGIEYIEIPWTVGNWAKRLWCEYVTMNRISKSLCPVDLWLSLHDTSPKVHAGRQAVYCQTSFPFMRWRMSDLRFDYKIALFSIFTRFAYKINIGSNDALIVQAQWLREGFSKMFGLPQDKFIVAPPKRSSMVLPLRSISDAPYTFLYPATPDCHKNFELLMEASSILEREIGNGRFKTVITLSGDENKYSGWLRKKWSSVSSITFAGFMSKEKLAQAYADSDCLVFPSRIETWGLPISEFAETGRPMLLADLPYAHETAAGYESALFFDSTDSRDLASKMKSMVEGTAMLTKVPDQEFREPFAEDWARLFDLLLK